MTIALRRIPNAFSHRTNVPVPHVHRDRGALESGRFGSTGRIISSPWEGLYLEDNDAAEPIQDAAQAATDLEHFLASLMFGE